MNLATAKAELEAAAAKPLEFDAGKSRAMGLAKVQYRIRRGTVVARYPPVVFTCNRASLNAGRTIVETWGSSRFNAKGAAFDDIFYDAMRNHDYNVAGDPGRLFDVKAERGGTVYEIGAQVTKLDMDLCVLLPRGITPKPSFIKGSSRIDVKWRVYSNFERKVIFRTETKGKGIDVEGQSESPWFLVDEAFVNAVDKLARDPEFFAAVSRDPRDRAAATYASPRRKFRKLSLRRARPLRGKLSDNIDRVRSAAVTIAKGQGHGSGFFIHKNGYLLTNAHVTGDAKFLRVELLSGRAILGEVIRSDKNRDVALVKVEEGGFPSLPVRDTPVKVAEEVYAVGTPLKRKYRNTVTKGVVSAFRRDDYFGTKVIQADVDIQGGNSGGPLVDASGNVVGITVSGVGQLSAGMNFFIPIMDALRILNIELKSPTRRAES